VRGQKKPAATNAAGSTVLIWVINYFCKLFGKLGFVELIIPCTTAKRQELFAPVILLSCRIQHILYKNSVSPRRVSHQHMSHRANQLSVLDDGTAAHE
jgi:gamma-glutamyl:cysteine ligase YbdK (ATP-grasp superfamily)